MTENYMTDNYTDGYLQSFRQVLADYRNIGNKSVLWVMGHSAKRSLHNSAIKYIPNAILNKVFNAQQVANFEVSKSQYSFLKIMYSLISLNLVNDDFLSNLTNVIDHPNLNLYKKYTGINICVAKLISSTKPMYMRRLQTLYRAWVRSLPSHCMKHKFYIERVVEEDLDVEPKNAKKLDEMMSKLDSARKAEDLGLQKDTCNEIKIKSTDKNYSVKFTTNGDIATPKKHNRLKALLMAHGVLAIILTAIGMGFVPTVLAASANGGIFISLVVVGVPSIIINVVLFKTSVPNLLKDIWHGRLLKNNEGKYIQSSIPLFIISLCGGITYGAMTFITSQSVFTAILTSFPAMATVASGAIIPLAAMFAISTGICFCALFFGSMIELVREGVAEQLSIFKLDFTQHLTKEDRLVNLLKLTGKLIKLALLLSAAVYLSIVETALLYSMSVAVLANPPLALFLTIIAAPANVLFTYKMYNSLFNMIMNLPSTITSFWEHCKRVRHNPIALYETLKWTFRFAGFFVINTLNARGNGLGLADELLNEHCRAFLKPLGINPASKAVILATKAIDMSDVYATNYSEGFDPAFGFVHGNPKPGLQKQTSSIQLPLASSDLTKVSDKLKRKTTDTQAPSDLTKVADKVIRKTTDTQTLPSEFNSSPSDDALYNIVPLRCNTSISDEAQCEPNYTLIESFPLEFNSTVLDQVKSEAQQIPPKIASNSSEVSLLAKETDPTSSVAELKKSPTVLTKNLSCGDMIAIKRSRGVIIQIQPSKSVSPVTSGHGQMKSPMLFSAQSKALDLTGSKSCPPVFGRSLDFPLQSQGALARHRYKIRRLIP